jgi:hypothetical protein
MKNYKGLIKTSIAFVTASALVLIPSAVQAAPAYPPTIEAPTVNEPIIAPVAPKKNVEVVVVPKATSETIPTVSSKQPVDVVSSTTKSVPASTATPIQVTSSLILGGVKKSEVANAPIATVNSKKGSAEIQVVTDVPTRVRVTKLPANTTARIQVVGAKGKLITLGTIRVDSKGNLILPPLTKDDEGKTTELRVVVGGKTYTYYIRSIG